MTVDADMHESPLQLLAGLRLEDGRPWGTAATPLQLADATAVLDLEGPRRHWLGRSKGYSKTSDVAGLALAVLLTQAPAGAEAYGAAGDRDQAALLLRSIRGYVDRTPGLAGKVLVESRRVSVPDRGTDLIVLPADSAGSHGLRPFWLVIDELANWVDDDQHRDFLDSLLAGLPKVARSRAVIMTTAGSPSHFSWPLYRTAGSDPAWRLSDVRGPAPWMSPAEVDGERRRLSNRPAVFERLFGNVWSGAVGQLVTPELVAAAAVLDGPQPWTPGRFYFGGIDLGLTHDRTAVAVVHAERVDGSMVRRFVLDRMEVRSGSKGHEVDLMAVENMVAALSREYRSPMFRLDPWQGELLAQRLRVRGVRVEKRAYSLKLFDQVATALYGLLREGLLCLPRDDLDLLEEFRQVRMRETSTPGRFRVDTDSGRRHDDMVMAVGYAVSLAMDVGGVAGRVESPQAAAAGRRALASMRPLTAGIAGMGF